MQKEVVVDAVDVDVDVDVDDDVASQKRLSMKQCAFHGQIENNVIGTTTTRSTSTCTFLASVVSYEVQRDYRLEILILLIKKVCGICPILVSTTYSYGTGTRTGYSYWYWYDGTGISL